jgi:hypothetical protein
MDEVLATTLRDAVHQRLDYLDTLVAEADLQSRAALAESEIARLTTAWRALLAQHQPDEDGRCPQCSGWRRPRKFPCSVWITAHQHLIAADGPLAAGPGRHTRADGRPSVASLATS